MAPKLTAAALRGARLVPLVIVGSAERSVAYGRVSTDTQREAESINVQKSILLKDITVRDDPSLPITAQRRLVAQFWDDGVSGTIPLEQRPDGQKLVNMVCERGDIKCDGKCSTPKQIDVVWATKLDRLARRLQILIQIEAFLRAHGVALRVLEFNIDTSTSMGKLIFTILGAIGEWEREVIIERTTNGRRQKASEGKFVGGRRTFGLKTDENGYLVVDETLVGNTNEMAYKIVQQIFDNVVNNDSSAFREAQRFGLSDRRVQSILHNPRYKGEGGMISGGTEWIAAEKNPPPAIVTPETWELAQTALLENRKNSSKNRHYDYLLTRLLVCCEPHDHTAVVDEDGVTWGRPVKTPGLCGRVFAGRVEKRHKYNVSYVYYYCSRGADCTAKMLRGVDVEDAVWQLVDDTLRDPKKALTRALDQRNQEEALHRIRTELRVILDALARLEAERQRVIRNGEKGLRKEHEVDARCAEIDAEIIPYQQQKAALDLQFRSLQVGNNINLAAISATDIAAQLDKIKADCVSGNAAAASKARELKAAILHKFISHIEVRTGEPLRVALRIGGLLAIDMTSLQETTDNQQHQDQNAASGEISESEHNPQELIIVREVSLPPGRRGSAA